MPLSRGRVYGIAMAVAMLLNLQVLKLHVPFNCLSQVKLRPSTLHLRRSRFRHISSVASASDNVEHEFGDDNDEEFGEEKLLSLSLLPTSPSPQVVEEAANKKKVPGPWRSRFPMLNSKEKKELHAHAHRLGKEIVVQHIGKWGVTPALTKSLSDTLEANELIKCKVLGNCNDELRKIAQELEDNLEAQIVKRVGRVLLVYRPSIRKLENQKKADKARASRSPSPTRRKRS